MSISALNSALMGAGDTAQQTSGRVSESTMDFYNLLTTQLTNQNPLEPVKETDFLGQMAQFSTVEQLQGMGKGMSESQAEQRWLDAQDYLGRKIAWTTASGDAAGGVVDQVDRDEDGEIWLDVDGHQVALDQVVAVAPGSGAPAGVIDDLR